MVTKACSWSVAAVLALCAGVCFSAAIAGDDPKEPPRSILVVLALRHAEAPSVAKSLTDLFQRNGDVKITSDARQNALLVMAPKDDLEKLKGFIELVDRPQTPGTPPTSAPRGREKDLEGMSDKELRRLVADLASQVRDLQERTRRLEAETRLRTMPLRAGTKAGGCSAPETKAPSLTEWPAETKIKVFTLVNADATSMVQVLTEFLPSVSQRIVWIAADKRTNSILASGPERDLAVLEAILLRLDEMRAGSSGGTPGARASGEAASKDQPKVRFDFQYKPWLDVLKNVAQQSGFKLTEPKITLRGTFNYRDSRAYTPHEAVDLLNRILATKGYKLVQHGQTLELVANPEDKPEERKP